MAILLNRLLPERRLQIFGTDVDDRAINFARRAVYSGHQLRGLESDFIEQHFRRLNSGYQLLKSIRDRVVFAKHDLLRDPLFLNLDLMSCRNLLIYLKLPAQEEVIRKFHFALKPKRCFSSVSLKIFRRKASTGFDRRHKIFVNKALLPGEKKVAPSREWAVSLEPSPAADGPDANRTDMFRRALLSNFAPASVLVDSNFRIIDSHGNIGRYLTLKHGKPDLNLLALAPKTLGASLRAQLHRARRTGMTSRGVPKPVELHSEEVMLNTSVHCLTDALAGEPLVYCVLLRDGHRKCPPR